MMQVDRDVWRLMKENQYSCVPQPMHDASPTALYILHAIRFEYQA
jgi:hypothetical protein